MKTGLRLISALLSASLLIPCVAYADDEDMFESEELEQYLNQIKGDNESDEAQPQITAAPTVVQSVKKSTVSEDVYLLISSLGFMSRAEIDMTGTVSRGYMAEVTARMTGYDHSRPATGSVYTDVNENTQYGYAIELMTDCGYFDGIGGGMFMPESGATDEQMAMVLIRFSGYSNMPNYEDAAARLYKNAGGTPELTYADMANMIYNMLDMKALNMSMVHGGLPSYSYDNKKSVLNSVYDVDKVSGIVSKNGKTALFADTDLNYDSAAIDSNSGYLIVKTAETGIENEIGKYVTAYYKYNEDEDINICIGYSVSETKNNIKSFSLGELDYSTVTEKELEYDDENGRERKLKYKQDAAVIYNGTYFSDADFSIAKLRDMEGTITFIDNDNDDTYDVINVEAYNVYRVKSVRLSDQIIFFKEAAAGSSYEIMPRDDSIELNDSIYDSIELTDANGVIAYLEDFTADTIVSVAKNSETASKRYIKVIVSDKTVSGMVKGVRMNESRRTVITMDDGNDYDVMQSADNLPSVSQNAKLHLTAFGNVAAVSFISSGGFYYGIMYKVSYDDHENSVTVKLLNDKNKIEEFKIPDSVRIDGKGVKDGETIYNMLRGVTLRDAGEILPQGKYPVRYRTSESGEVIEIDTPTLGQTESENSMTLMTKLEDATMLNYVFGTQVPVHPNTPLFIITNAITGTSEWDAEVFSNVSYSKVAVVSDYIKDFLQNRKTMAAFKINKDSYYADLIVMIEGASRPSNGTTLFMVDKKTETYDEEYGGTVPKLKGLLGGVEMELVAAPGMAESTVLADLKQGDVIQCGRDSSGKIVAARPVVKNRDGEKAIGKLADTEDDNQSFNSLRAGDKGKISGAIVYGYVLKREGDLVKLRVITPEKRAETYKLYDRNITDEIPAQEGWVSIPGSTPVMVYDPSKKFPVYAGTYDEITDDGAKRSIIGLRYQSSTILREVIVFNDAE